MNEDERRTLVEFLYSESLLDARALDAKFGEQLRAEALARKPKKTPTVIALMSAEIERTRARRNPEAEGRDPRKKKS